MDGMKEHEIHQITGLPDENCKKIWSIYVAALPTILQQSNAANRPSNNEPKPNN
jgi:hypothetical protein